MHPIDNMNPELEIYKDLERLLNDGLESKGNGDETSDSDTEHLERLCHAVETALTIIKDRKATIEEKEFNSPNYYQKAQGEV